MPIVYRTQAAPPFASKWRISLRILGSVRCDAGYQIEIAIVVEIGPGCRIRWDQIRQPLLGGHVGEFPVAVIYRFAFLLY